MIGTFVVCSLPASGQRYCDPGEEEEEEVAENEHEEEDEEEEGEESASTSALETVWVSTSGSDVAISLRGAAETVGLALKFGGPATS